MWLRYSRERALSSLPDRAMRPLPAQRPSRAGSRLGTVIQEEFETPALVVRPGVGSTRRWRQAESRCRAPKSDISARYASGEINFCECVIFCTKGVNIRQRTSYKFFGNPRILTVNLRLQLFFHLIISTHARLSGTSKLINSNNRMH